MASLLSLGLMGGCIPSGPERSRPLEYALWIEGTLWSETGDEEAAFRLLDVQRIFYKIGDLDLEGDRLVWASGLSLPRALPLGAVTLVVGATERVRANVRRVSEQQLVDRLREALERVRGAGFSCSGIHVDFLEGEAWDVFERLLDRIRRGGLGPLTISATVRAAWARERGLLDLVRRLDFFIVRVVGEGRRADDSSLVASVDFREIASVIRRFERLGVPFYIEGHVRGECFLHDRLQRLHALPEAPDLLRLVRGAEFRLIESYPLGLAQTRMSVPTDFAGEYVLVLSPRAPSRMGERILRPEERMICRVPTAGRVRRQIEAVEATPSPWVLGLVLWRYSAPEDLLGVPLSQIALVRRGGVLEPKLTIAGEIVERGDALTLTLRVRNVGMQESAIAERALALHLRLVGARVRRIHLGDFAEWARDSNPPSAEEGSRETRLVLYARGIGRGETLHASVVLSSAARDRTGFPWGVPLRLYVAYRVRDPDGWILLSEPESEIAVTPRTAISSSRRDARDTIWAEESAP